MYLSILKNKLVYSIKFFPIVLFTFVSVFAYPGEKLALIIAVGNYPANSGWCNLSSANDARLMRVLLRKQGFQDKNITTIKDEKATKTNILKALDMLISQSNKSDVVVFHFSGHGQQITDLNGDEPDGYDEALITYDALKTPSGTYKGKCHLIDDELNSYLNRLRKKVGTNGDIIFFLDACHSGTATRGVDNNNIYRGASTKFDLIPPKENSAENNQTFDEQTNFQERGLEELSPYAIFSASGQQELNLEIKDNNNVGYGSLTFALGKVLGNNVEKLTYTGLFDLVRNEMWAQFGGKHQQSPQLEGLPNRTIFAGQAVLIPPHCRVLRQVNSQKVVVDVGELNNLTIGSEICFYPINTINPKNTTLLAKGIVKSVGLAESDVFFNSDVEKIKLKDAWGFVTRFQSKKSNVNDTRADILRRVSASDASLNVTFELVDSKTEKVIPFNHPFKIGDSYLLRISNNGYIDAFFQLIDIWPDNQIRLVFDVTKHTPNDLFIKAGKTKVFNNPPIRMTNPTGVEMFKLVASEKQLDLSPITTKLPVKNRGSIPTGLEQMISDLFETGNKRGKYSYNKINIFTRIFTIYEK